ncbi:hypothetical protein EV702DRAFT_738031 [Suillus placidus]|uniref:Uncharacterized protein n=1 Tax=Suillus placidus TaxID=48579 RepID=A0A9P7A1K3_9AGAM|nr:hypothetical protein EV702DRAFT_738031 [Suillus placidus]
MMKSTTKSTAVWFIDIAAAVYIVSVPVALSYPKTVVWNNEQPYPALPARAPRQRHLRRLVDHESSGYRLTFRHLLIKFLIVPRMVQHHDESSIGFLLLIMIS